jgi:hypothetical protein
MTDPKPKRRWFVCRLSALLIIAASCVVLRVWLDLKMHAYKRQQEIALEIMRHGGTAHFGDIFVPVSFVGFRPNGTDDDRLKLLDRLSQIESVQLEGSNVTDAVLEHLRGLHQLKTVLLGGCTQVTDAGLDRLSGLSQLRELDLSDTQVTVAGIAHLSGLTKLRRINVRGTNAEGESEKLQQAFPNQKIEWTPPPMGSWDTGWGRGEFGVELLRMILL